MRPAFIRPLIPSTAKTPPKGEDWCMSPGGMGYHFQIIKSGRDFRLCSKSGADYSDRLPRMSEWFTHLPTQAAILDGELCLLGADGRAKFPALLAEMQSRWPDEERLMFFAFDLLHQDGVYLHGLALSERKRDLHCLCARSRVPFLKEIQSFPNGDLLLEHCEKFGFEGVVSKRLASRYVSGPSRAWVKVKCPGWIEANQQWFELFEGK